MPIPLVLALIFVSIISIFSFSKRNEFILFLAIISAIILGIAIGFRDIHFGIDTPTYMGMFEDLKMHDLDSIFSLYRTDVLFYYTAKVLLNLTDSISITMLMISVIGILFLTAGYSRNLSSEKYFLLPLLVMVFVSSYTGLLQFGNTIRQSLTIGLYLLLVYEINRKRIVTCGVISSLIAMFHFGSLLVVLSIVFVFFVTKRTIEKRFLAYIIVSLIVAPIMIVISKMSSSFYLFQLIQNYSSFESSSTIILRVILNMFTSIFIYIYSEEKLDRIKNIYFSSVIILIMTLPILELAKRVVPYVEVLQFMLLLSILFKRPIKRSLIYLTPIVFILISFVIVNLPPIIINYKYL